jgi:filamentous hemagglutinin
VTAAVGSVDELANALSGRTSSVAAGDAAATARGSTGGSSAQGGVLELGGGPNGSKIPGAKNIDPSDPNAIGSDMRNMPNVADNSQRQVLVSNPYLQGVEPNARAMNSYLPEAARVTQPGGEIIISGNSRNPFFTNMPTAAELDALGLEIKYQGPLLPSLTSQTFTTTSGRTIDPSTMQTIIFVKKKK